MSPIKSLPIWFSVLCSSFCILGSSFCILCSAFYVLEAQTFKYEVFDTDLPPKSVYQERRARLLDSLPKNSIAIVLSADERNRQNDVDYEYRQNSNMLYLTGYPHPGATLLLSESGIVMNGKTHHEILFVPNRNPEREQWTGVTAGPKETMEFYGVDASLTADMLTKVLRSILKTDTSGLAGSENIDVRNVDSVKKLLVDGWATRFVEMPLLGKNLYVDKEIRKGLLSEYKDIEIESSISPLISMRMIKDTSELRLMQKAIDVSVAGHRYAMEHAKPGMKEFEIEALVEFGFKSGGAEDVGYPSIVGSSYNACILHYTSNRRPSISGDLILSDCGAEYHGYTADITRTFPLNGKFTSEQKIIYNIVLEAQDSGIVASVVNAPFKSPHMAAMRVVTRRLFENGIITDSADAKKYFMHGTSHYLGLDVHDVGTRGPFHANTVITVEPGIYIPDGSACDKKWWNIGVRIEDDVLITPNGPEVLSAALPRKAEEIEGLVGSAIK